MRSGEEWSRERERDKQQPPAFSKSGDFFEIVVATTYNVMVQWSHTKGKETEMTTKKTKAERLFKHIRLCAERAIRELHGQKVDSIGSYLFEDECRSTRTCNAVQKCLDNYNKWTDIYETEKADEFTEERREVARIIQNTIDNQRKAIAKRKAIFDAI